MMPNAALRGRRVGGQLFIGAPELLVVSQVSFTLVHVSYRTRFVPSQKNKGSNGTRDRSIPRSLQR